MRNLYSFLSLQEDVSAEEIQEAFGAFRKGLMKYSPGVELSDEELRSRRPEIWDAYMVLLDPLSKKEHDELLERDRIHELYESKNKPAESEEQKKSNDKARFIGFVTLLILIALYIYFTGNPGNLPERPSWRKHYITEEVSLLLPAGIDTSVNIIPPFLLHYIKKGSCYRSVLKGGFSVTIAQFDMNEYYKISQKDVSYIVNVEMSSHMTIVAPDSVNYTMNLHGYNAFIRKGNYALDGTLHAFENYSLVNGTSAIKVIITYIPGNELHSRYAEIVFKSLMI